MFWYIPKSKWYFLSNNSKMKVCERERKKAYNFNSLGMFAYEFGISEPSKSLLSSWLQSRELGRVGMLVNLLY